MSDILKLMKDAQSKSTSKPSDIPTKKSKPQHDGVTSEYRVIGNTRQTCMACGRVTHHSDIKKDGICFSCSVDFGKDAEPTEGLKTTHPATVPGWSGSLQELAYAVENLRYDETSKFIYHLAQAFRVRAQADREAGRKFLADRLSSVASELGGAHYHAFRAWEICLPHMKKDG
jgi:hypothetical protein